MTRGMAGANTLVMANTQNTKTPRSRDLLLTFFPSQFHSSLLLLLLLLLLFVREPLINGKENGSSMGTPLD